MRLIAFGCSTVAALFAPAALAVTVAVDVGHFTAEPGATSSRGVPEFQFNLALAREIVLALKAKSFATLTIGADGEARELLGRTRAARGTDFFLSVHHDSIKARYQSEWQFDGVTRKYSDLVSGFSLFVSRRNPALQQSLACASAIGARLRAAGFHPSRYHADPELGAGRPFADEENGVHYFDNLAVARSASSAAVLLEAGVIVNRDEELMLSKEETRSRIAAAVADGLSSCLEARPPGADKGESR